MLLSEIQGAELTVPDRRYIMSKIICDVCGTTYAETATQCPICGCARKSVDQTGADSTKSIDSSSYAYVRGGRFSKSNVRKRNRTGKDFERRSAAAPAPAPKAQNEARPARRTTAEKKEENNGSVNKGLVAVVIILLLAIVAVTAFICVKFLLPSGNTNPTDGPGISTAPSTTVQDPTESTAAGIPCVGLTLSGSTIEFSEQNNGWLLDVEVEPADTTETVVFTSSDENVATVSQTGYITAVGGGQAVITVTCGSAKAECTVICSFGQTTEPTTPVDPEFVFEFNTKYIDEYSGKYDTTIDGAGKTWRAYKPSMTVAPEDIIWTVDDPSICSIDNGIVTAIAPGKTDIHAQYGGKTYTCIVRCSWEVEEETEPTEPSEGGEETVTVSISKEDVTLHISSDNSFTLRLQDSNGNVLEVEWKAETEGIVTIEGNKITGVAVGTTKVSTTYEGVTYPCIVRVAE